MPQKKKRKDAIGSGDSNVDGNVPTLCDGLANDDDDDDDNVSTDPFVLVVLLEQLG